MCEGSAVTRHRSALPRGYAACAIIVLLLAQLGALVHHATVQHVRCDHGELVEAPMLAKHALDASRLVAVEHGQADAGDEHCAVANGVRSDARVAAPSVVSALAPALVEQPRFILDRVAPPADLYRTAPKTSPPDSIALS